MSWSSGENIQQDQDLCRTSIRSSRPGASIAVTFLRFEKYCGAHKITKRMEIERKSKGWSGVTGFCPDWKCDGIRKASASPRSGLRNKKARCGNSTSGFLNLGAGLVSRAGSRKLRGAATCERVRLRDNALRANSRSPAEGTETLSGRYPFEAMLCSSSWRLPVE